MKAIRKSDGKEIEITRLLVDSLQDVNNQNHCRKFIDTDGKAYDTYEIELLPDEPTKEAANPIDWEQRRYEIAKDVMNGFAGNTYPWEELRCKEIASASIELADELIKQLKGE